MLNSVGKVLSVVMPVYNEEETIDSIIGMVLKRPEVGELIIIDDCSRDGTRDRLKKHEGEPGIKLLYQEVNCGKGAAVTRGIAAASLDYVIIQDADHEYSPDDYPLVLEPLVKDKADVVYGSRFMGTPGMVRYFRHEMGNKVLTFMSNVFTDIHLTDMETCYKCFRREVIQNINLNAQRFGIEVEFAAKLAAARCLRIFEVPISYNPRRYDEGKKITWRDGISALYHIIRYNLFDDRKKFYKRPWKEILKG
ncbi:MAG: glycosyltransferase family 2 protein [Victivallales bacterium]|nr:glycosyltransferase family 2 protein [Victivallales bacterium]